MSKKLVEEFREVYAKCFYLYGDDEAYQDICTMSEERLINDALIFAKKHFEESIKEFKK